MNKTFRDNYAVVCELQKLFLPKGRYEIANASRNSLAQYLDNLGRASEGLPERILKFPEGDIPKIRRMCKRKGIDISTFEAVRRNSRRINETLNEYYHVA